jgi:MFS family permease
MIGIFILSITLLSIPIFNITTNNIFIWITILFIGRIGATITETENYAYFYKKIDGRSAGLIALFQNMVNIAFIFVTIVGAVLINIFNINLPIIFLIVGILGLLSIFIIIKIRDTEIKRRHALENANKIIKKEEEVKEAIAEAEWETRN